MKTLKQTYSITGMTCEGCKASIEKSLLKIKGIHKIIVHLKKGEATISMNPAISTKELQENIPKKYLITKKTMAKPPSFKPAPTKREQLKPLLLIFLYLITASLLLNYKEGSLKTAMLDFMGLFYLVFSFFKILDLKGFPDSFRMYDPLAKKVAWYAWVYPFIEITLGILFLMRYQIPLALWTTLFILGMTTIGVTKTLLNKKTIRCACLGTLLKLPMTEATLIENSIMILMAINLLIP